MSGSIDWSAESSNHKTQSRNQQQVKSDSTRYMSRSIGWSTESWNQCICRTNKEWRSSLDTSRSIGWSTESSESENPSTRRATSPSLLDRRTDPSVDLPRHWQSYSYVLDKRIILNRWAILESAPTIALPKQQQASSNNVSWRIISAVQWFNWFQWY